MSETSSAPPPEPAGRRPPRWLVVALPLVVLVLAAAIAGARRYATHDSGACTGSCHAAQPKAHVASAGHKGVRCQACHSVSGGEGLRLLMARMTGSRSVRAHGQVKASSCTSCHNDIDARWPKIAETEGHRLHEGVAKVDCLSCHESSSHAGRVQAQVCIGCHKASHLHAKKDFNEAARPQCLSCHNFSSSSGGKPWLTIDRCDSCHSEAAKSHKGNADIVPASVIRPQDLHGGVDCKLCHQPHHDYGNGAKEPPCQQCHNIKIGTEDVQLPKEHHECQSCHKVHAPLKRADQQCKRCHEQARLREGGKRSTALEHDECASCHQPHTWVPDKNGCVKCHNKQATLVFTRSPVQHRKCVNCHDVHGPPPVGTICGKCHTANARKMQAGPARHQICTSCHNPHDPLPKAPQACITCHANEVRQVVAMGPPQHASGSCPSCHTIHGNPKITIQACGKCHQDKLALVAKAGPKPHQNCLSCHKQHVFSVRGTRLPCLNCHQKIVKTAEIHTGKCTKCHDHHGEPDVPQARCLGCHKQIHLAPVNPTHEKCNSCHKPHKKKEAALDQCRHCHADKANVANLWPAQSAHHNACNNCHNQHDVRQKKPCGTCHAKEAQMVKVNPKHQCTGCHAPHQAPPSTLAGWYGRCESCHKSEATESKQHTACNNCHKPHGFMPPKCVTCHAPNIRKGLHTVKAHSDCSKCHETHKASLPTRENCLACHKDKVNHQVGAQRCQACHLFK